MPWNRPQLRVRTLMMVVVLVAVSFSGVRLYRWYNAGVEVDAWVGWDLADMARRYGPPSPSELDEASSGASLKLQDPHERKTYTAWIFTTRHGTLYVWVRPRGGRQVCYHSVWYRFGPLVY